MSSGSSKPDAPRPCLIALGSNQGERDQLLGSARDALIALEECGGLLGQASLYESDPVDCPEGSPLFLNTVIEISWLGQARDLLAESLSIEHQLGRRRSVRNAPRPIDIDLLSFGGEVIDTPQLQLPHPRFHLRRFVLQPLAEIRPSLILPGQIADCATLLRELNSDEADLRVFKRNW